VLVVEDDSSIREALLDLLVEEGHDVATAADTSAARRAFGEHAPDVVLLDLLLDGESAEPLIVEWMALPQPPAILLTSASNGLAAIARRYDLATIGKPFEVDELLGRIADVARSR
jgi:two-component system OmpR family response regulator